MTSKMSPALQDGTPSPKAGETPPGTKPADLAPLENLSRAPTPDEPSDAHQHSSLRAQEVFNRASEAAAAGDEEQSVQEYLRCAAAAESAHEWYLVALSCERVGDFLLHPKPPTDLSRALRMYRRAAAAYEQSGLFTEARELSYRVNSLRLWRAREVGLSWLARGELLLYWLTAGFGYRPLRVIGAAAIVVLSYGIVYWLIAGAVDYETRQTAGLVDCVYFSGITFATVGYGDLVPAAHARLVALSEGFLGAFLMGFFVVVLAHRLARA